MPGPELALVDLGDRDEQLRRGATMVKVAWPLAAAADCAVWLRELLR